LTGWVLATASGEHLAHDDFTNLASVELGAGDGFFDHNSAQLGSGHLGDRATKLAYGGAGGGYDDDVLHFSLSLVGWWVGLGIRGRGVFERRGRKGYAESAEEEKKKKYKKIPKF
jgi:hypothetical protein